MKKIVLLAFSIILFATAYAQTVRKVVPITVYSAPDSTKIFNQPFEAGTLILNRQNGSMYMLGKSYANMSLSTAPKTKTNLLDFPDTVRQSIFAVNSTTIDLMSPIGTSTKYSNYYQTKDTFEIQTVGTYTMGVQRTAGIESKAGHLSLFFERTNLDANINLYDGLITVEAVKGIQYSPMPLFENFEDNSLVPKSFVDSVSAVLLDSIGLDTNNLKIGYGLEILGDSINLSQEVFDSIAAVPVYTGSVSITIVGDSINVAQSVYDSIANEIAEIPSMSGGSGITVTDTVISLGGSLSEALYLDGESKSFAIDSLYTYTISVIDTSINSLSGITLDTSKAVLINSDSTTLNTIGVSMDYIQFTSLNKDSSTLYSHVMTDSTDVITSTNTTFAGVEYGADYSANYTGRSLVDRDNAMKYAVIDAAAPASATATGVKGTVVITAGYIYICVETDTWVRVAITTWE